MGDILARSVAPRNASRRQGVGSPEAGGTNGRLPSLRLVGISSDNPRDGRISSLSVRIDQPQIHPAGVWIFDDSSRGPEPVKPSAVRNLWIAAFVWTCVAAPAGAGGLYSYIDDRGVIHFSDMPHDPRYEAVKRRPRALALSPLGASEAPIQHTFDFLIARTARDFSVDPALVKAVIAAESNFRIDAVSRVGALGLMQMMPVTFREVWKDHALQPGIHEPRWNIAAGIGYDRYLYDRWSRRVPASQRLQFTLASYNAGYTGVSRAVERARGAGEDGDDWNRVARYAPLETRNYVEKIRALMGDSG